MVSTWNEKTAMEAAIATLQGRVATLQERIAAAKILLDRGCHAYVFLALDGDESALEMARQ